MGQRRVLVIGSQCDALQHLSFLPDVARELYAVMVDTDRGACGPALDPTGLLIDPSVAEMQDAVEAAYRSAAKEEATLLIAYIGHAERAGDDYFLLPRDAANPPTSRTAVHLTNLIKDVHRTASGHVDGLAVLVDACYSGQGAFSAAEIWTQQLKGTLRFEVMVAADADRTAANACFSKSLAGLLREGISEVPDQYLHCNRLRTRIAKRCPRQVPHNPTWDADEGLWLAKNTGPVGEPWAQTPLADEIRRLTLKYQVTPVVRKVISRSQDHRCVAVVGNAGSGKSALMAALAWPAVTHEVVPARFVHAVALLTEATTPQEFSRILSDQLARSVPRFREAQQQFAHETPYVEQQRLTTLERQVVGPLRRLAPYTEVRLAVDALDRLATGARGAVMDALEDLKYLPFMRLIVTAHPETPLPNGVSILPLRPAPSNEVANYLEQRAVARARHQEITEIAKGNWLVARVLAEVLSGSPEAEISAGRLALGDAYDELLSRCGANDNNAIRRVLSVLAAAGAGPLLPLGLLCAATEKLGGPGIPPRIRDELVRLRGLAVRSSAGTDQEQAGLFHQTLVDHLVGRAPEDVRGAHRALADCIHSLVPAGASVVDPGDAVQRYAFEAEAEHLWALGDTVLALRRLAIRRAAAPRDNLRRWLLWDARVRNELGTDDPDALTTRSNIAYWTGECGDAPEALRLGQELLPDRTRVLGADHQDTLRTRNTIARWTGHCGDAREALRLFLELLPDQTGVLGADHPDTLTTRYNIARWTGECGDAPEALRLLQELLPDRTRMLDADHPATLTTRSNIARWTGHCGDAREALRLFLELLPDQTRVLGAGHPDTLTTRSNIAYWTGECGDVPEALRLGQELLPDRTRVLGADHPATLRTRYNIAHWTGGCGDAPEALRLLQELLPDQTRVLGADHQDTLTTRDLMHLYRER